MFTTVSMTGAGMAAYLLALGLKYFGVEVAQDQAAEAIANIVALAGFVTMVYGQLKRRDLTLGIWRKKPLN